MVSEEDAQSLSNQRVGRHINSFESSRRKYHADDGVIHVSEVENSRDLGKRHVREIRRASPLWASQHNG